MNHLFFGFIPSAPDTFWILLIVLVLFGANKLPELARGLGRSIGEFQKAKNELEREIHKAANESAQPKLESRPDTVAHVEKPTETNKTV